MNDQTIEATLILWRDIPTQVMIGKGRRAQKRMLADRFMVAVDKAAMADGAKSADDYLDDWRRVVVALPQSDETESALEAFAVLIETEFPTQKLADIAREGGRISPETKTPWSNQ